MKKSPVLFILALSLLAAVFIIAMPGSVATGASQASFEPHNFVPHELLVKFKEGAVGDLAQNKAQAGKTYQYRIRAGNPLGYSSYSNTIPIEVIEW